MTTTPNTNNHATFQPVAMLDQKSTSMNTPTKNSAPAVSLLRQSLTWLALALSVSAWLPATAAEHPAKPSKARQVAKRLLDKPLPPATSVAEFSARGKGKKSAELKSATTAAPLAFTFKDIAAPTAPDLAATADVILSADVTALATQLDKNPSKLFAWVYDNVQMVPTWGATQTASQVIQSRRANAHDAATALIGLLRASGVPSRYVTGTIEIPIGVAQNWLGGVDANGVTRLLTQGGIRHVAVLSAGVVQAIQMEHVWVEAWVDFIPARGGLPARVGGGDTWIPLDAAFKRGAVIAAPSLTQQINYSSVSLSQRLAAATLNSSTRQIVGVTSAMLLTDAAAHKAKLDTAIAASAAGATGARTADLFTRSESSAYTLGFLAGTLQYKVNVILDRSPAIAEPQRWSFRLALYGSPTDQAQGRIAATWAGSVAEATAKQLAISFTADAAGTTQLAQAATALTQQIPAYLINGASHLRIDGVSQGATAIGLMGTQHAASAELYDPRQDAWLPLNAWNLAAGETSSVVVDSGAVTTASLADVRDRTQALKTALAANDVGSLSNSSTAASLLATTAQLYRAQALQEANALRLANSAVGGALPAVTLTRSLARIETASGAIRSFTTERIALNTLYAGEEIVTRTNSPAADARLQHALAGRISIRTAQLLEGLWGNTAQGDKAASTARAFRAGLDLGQPLQAIAADNTAATLAAVAPTTTPGALSDTDKATISDATRIGQLGVIHPQPVTLGAWVGSGFALSDADSGVTTTDIVDLDSAQFQRAVNGDVNELLFLDGWKANSQAASALARLTRVLDGTLTRVPLSLAALNADRAQTWATDPRAGSLAAALWLADFSTAANSLYGADNTRSLTLLAAGDSASADDGGIPYRDQPPRFVSAPIKLAAAGDAYRYAVQTFDPQGYPVTLRLVAPAPAPAGLTLTAGVLAWAAPVAGSYPIIIEAHNGKLPATQSYTLTVTAGAPLSIQLDIAPQFVAVGQTAVLSTNAIGGRAPRTVTAAVDGTPITLDATGRANVPTTVPGGHSVVVTVTDSLGATTTATSFYGVAVAGDTTKPTVTVTAPLDGDEITSATNIVATITEPNLAGYTVMVSPADLNQWSEIARGAGAPPAGVVGRFNPAALVNGLYDIVVIAWDANGNTFNDLITVMVSGEAKPGQFGLTFRDAQVEVATLPLAVHRTYDSRRRGENLDFGYGWSVDYQDIKIQTNGILGTGWQVFTTGSGFAQKICVMPFGARIATVRLPGGKLERFDFKAKPECQPTLGYNGFVQQEFIPRAGTTSKLEATDVGDLRIAGQDLVDFSTAETVNPQAFKLTSLDGTQYFLDRSFGIKSIKDQYGNTLTFSANGIAHSDGKSLTFTRDVPVAPATRGRITKVTLPDTTFLTYQYDAAGNLTSMTDLRGFQSRFTYDSQHSLVDYYDATGNLMMKSEYDADGRLIRQTDALGNAIALNRVVPNPVETIVDRRGNSTEYTYDAAGNITSSKDALGRTTGYTYDANHNETSTTDPLGNKTTRTFDAYGNVLEETNPLGQKTATAYNPEGKPTQITDALGRITKYEYDPSGNPKKLIDATGQATAIGYSLKGELASLADAAGNTTVYNYGSDTTGQRIKVSEVDALGRTTNYKYDANGRQTEMTRTRTSNDGSNTLITLKTNKTYDAAGNVLTDTDATGATTTSTYTAQNKLASTTDARGNKTSYDYNLRSELTKTTHPDGKTDTTEFDANGNQTKTCDRAGRCRTTTLDALDRTTDTAAPGNTPAQAQRTTYDAAGRATATIDERGNTSTHAYDSAGKKTSSTDALGRTTTYAYDAAGNMTSSTDARNNVTTYTYDSLNRRTQTGFPGGSTSKSAYDAIGRKTLDTDQAGLTTRYAYDKLSRLTQVEDGITAAQLAANPTAAFGTLGNVTRYAYDELGNKISQTDAQGRITKWDYDNAGRLISRTLPASTQAAPQTERFAYDLVGNRVSHTDFNGKQTRWDYDNLNRAFKETRADGSILTTAFTDSGAVDSITQVTPSGTNAGTRVQTYRYDLQDRLIEATSPEGSITYAYDAAGNRAGHSTIATSGSTTTATSTTIDYDALNRPIKQTDTVGTGANAKTTETTWLFDENGNKKEQHVKTTSGTAPIDPTSGIKATYTYDTQNRLTGIEQRRANDATATGLIASYTYTLNARGQKTKIVETSAAIAPNPANPTGTPAITRTKDYLYNARNQLTQERVVTVAGTAAATRQIDVTYDAAGNQSQKVDAFTAAGASAPTTATTIYTVDANDRLTSETQTGAVTATTSYQYDTNGNQIKKTETRTAPTAITNVTSYEWANHGGRNVLASVTLPNGNKVSYRYDASGNKIADVKQTNPTGPPTSADQTTSYLIDGNTAFAQVVQAGTTAATGANANQLNGARVFNRSIAGELLAQQNNGSTAQTLIPLSDAQMSVRVVADATATNATSPSLIASQYYEGYGAGADAITGAPIDAASAANNAALMAFGYDGEQTDADTGLVYLRARWYEAGTGRFLSVDPHPGAMKSALTLNDYAFVSGDPVNRTDPSGKFGLGEMGAANNIASTLINIQIDFSFNLLDGITSKGEGGVSGPLFFGIASLGPTAAPKLFRLLSRTFRKLNLPEVKHIDMAHITGTHVTAATKRINGYHLREGGVDLAGFSVKVVRGPNSQGIYEAEVFFNGQSKVGNGMSTFYPDNWTAARLETEILGAYLKSGGVTGRSWSGTSPSGVKIKGFIDDGGVITTAYPLFL